MCVCICMGTHVCMGVQDVGIFFDCFLCIKAWSLPNQKFTILANICSRDPMSLPPVCWDVIGRPPHPPSPYLDSEVCWVSLGSNIGMVWWPEPHRLDRLLTAHSSNIIYVTGHSRSQWLKAVTIFHLLGVGYFQLTVPVWALQYMVIK